MRTTLAIVEPPPTAAALNVLDVPPAFRPPFPFPYPGHQRGPMIEPFVHGYLVRHARQIVLDEPWTYVPVYWTSHACRRSRMSKWRRGWARRRLQAFLDRSLRPGVRYFTVSQHDDGLTQRGEIVPPVPIFEFSAGGVGDVPLPLLCDDHCPVTDSAADSAVRPRDILASFVGALANPRCRYPCREAMVAALAGCDGYVIEDVAAQWGASDAASLAAQERQFVDLMHRSVFALCPRGYGKTSFRMYEAMQLGAIPVYIYDEPWLPYAADLDWNEFCVLVPLERASGLDAILRGKTPDQIAAMQRRIRQLRPDYFTLEGAARHVVETMRHLAAPSTRRAP